MYTKPLKQLSVPEMEQVNTVLMIENMFSLNGDND